MAWDFSTEPEFEEKLAWMRSFVRDEIFPLETLDLSHTAILEAVAPLKVEVKKPGCGRPTCRPSSVAAASAR